MEKMISDSDASCKDSYVTFLVAGRGPTLVWVSRGSSLRRYSGSRDP